MCQHESIKGKNKGQMCTRSGKYELNGKTYCKRHYDYLNQNENVEQKEMKEEETINEVEENKELNNDKQEMTIEKPEVVVEKQEEKPKEKEEVIELKAKVKNTNMKQKNSERTVKQVEQKTIFDEIMESVRNSRKNIDISKVPIQQRRGGLIYG